MIVRRFVCASLVAVACAAAANGVTARAAGGAGFPGVGHDGDRQAQAQTPPSATPQVGTPELLFDQGKRLFDQFQYDQAVPLLDQVIAKLSGGGQILKPDLLVQAYELRARSRFALGDAPAAEQDFSALLLITPAFKLGAGISPRVVEIFEAVKKLTVGQINASMTPAGEVQIDGRPYMLPVDPLLIDLPVGDHQLSITRPGYRPVSQKFTVAAGDPAPLALTLERVSSTLSVTTIPDAVDVVLDGTLRGQTKRVEGVSDGTASLMLTDIQTGPHRLQLRRDCYKDVERAVPIEQHGDIHIDAVTLTPAVANVKIEGADAGSSLFIDGAPRGQAPPELTVCEGPHVIEIRGAKGRFVDRRDWKTGDVATLTAELRSAFPIVASRAGSGVPVEQLRANVERALSSVKSLLVYVPADTELTAALKETAVPTDWLANELGSNPNAPKVPKEVKRDLGRRLAAKLGVQGLAAVSTGQDPYVVTVMLFAAGSGEPDVITLNLADAAARTRAIDLLTAPLPALIRPSLESAVVDLVGVQGAVVIRPDGVGAKAGLEAGDIIVGAAGAPIKSVADLRAKVATIHPPVLDLALDVKKGPTGAQRTISGTVAMVADTLPLQDPGLLYNRALTSLQDMTKTATTPVEQAALHVNLAIVMMRLGNWDDALIELGATKLPDGAGVSAGTVAYLTGLCEEALGRTTEATAAFTKAAAAPKARLSSEGPLVAPLAQQKLHPRR